MQANEDDEEYFRSTEFKQTLARYEKSVSENSPVYMEADELTDIAEYYMTREREQDADKAIRYALSLHPDSVDPQVFLARKQLFKGNVREAIRISRAIPEQDDREVKFLNAEIMVKQGLLRQATSYMLQEWRKLDEDRDHFLYDCAGIFMDYNQWEYALMWINRLLRLCPKYPKAKRTKAELLVCLCRYSEAVPVLDDLLDDDPYQKDVWNLLAESQGAQEQYAEAMESVENVLAIDKDDCKAKVTKAGCLFHMNQPQEAHCLYQEYLLQEPHDDYVLYLDAVCLASMGRYPEASRQIEAAMDNCPADSQQYVHLLLEQAYIESKLHHLQQALDAIMLAECMQSDDMDYEYSLLKGQVYLENGDADKALTFFTSAIRFSGNRRNTLMLIGVAYGDAERYTEAVQVMLTVLRTFPNAVGGASPIPYLAYYYHCLGDEEQSLSFLKHAAKADRETTEQLFAPLYPGVIPDEYYLYAFRNIHGRFPDEEE